MAIIQATRQAKKHRFYSELLSTIRNMAHFNASNVTKNICFAGFFRG